MYRVRNRGKNILSRWPECTKAVTYFSARPFTMKRMAKLLKYFREHPQSVGETYVEHFGVATSFGFSLINAGLACLIHAVLPCLFTTYARSTIADLHGRMVTHRVRRNHDDAGRLNSPA